MGRVAGWATAVLLAAAGGCGGGRLGRDEAAALLREAVRGETLGVSLFTGRLRCPAGCDGCFGGQLFEVAVGEGWVEVECLDDAAQVIRPTALGERRLVGGRPQEDGSVWHDVALGTVRILAVDGVESVGPGWAAASYRWSWEATDIGIELLGGGPRAVAGTDYRLCGEVSRWIATSDDCDAAIGSGTAEFFHESGSGWALTVPSPGGGLLGPR